jgi:hypothetical protein
MLNPWAFSFNYRFSKMDAHTEFLQSVVEYVKVNPEVAPQVTAACSMGISEALRESRHRAADFEALFAMTAARRFPETSKSYAASVLEKWQGKSSLNHDETIAQLRKGAK